MKKKLMILGAGIYQVPLIQCAKRLGYETIAVSIPGNYPGFSIADHVLYINTTDAKAVCKAAQDFQISGIITTGTDVCLPTIGYVVDCLQLHGPDYACCCCAQNKISMKKCFIEHGVSTSCFKAFSDISKAKVFASKIGFPIMVKAPDLSGSRGVTKASNEVELSNAWERARACSHSSEIIIEKFVSGNEFGGHVIMNGNKVSDVILHNTTTSPYPYSAPIGHSLPSILPDSVQEKAKEELAKAAEALGCRDCVANADMILQNDEPFIIEMTARMGGTCLPENLSYCYQQDLYEYMIGQAVGERGSYGGKVVVPNAVALLQSAKDGTVKRIYVPESVEKNQALLDLHLDISVGDVVHAFKTGPDRIGHIIAKGESALSAEKTCQTLMRQIELEVE